MIRAPGTRVTAETGAPPCTGRATLSGPARPLDQPRGTVILETSGLWVACLRLEDRPGVSPITTVGRFDTVVAAQLAADEVWAAR